jgi:Rab3 GTPase-activating protein catalytic subunit
MAANHVSGNSETIEDLRRLCVIFEHIEKLLTLASSLHRTFLQAPRLSETIFTDYYNFYLPRMGTGSPGSLEVDEKVKLLSCHESCFLLIAIHQSDCIGPWICIK